MNIIRAIHCRCLLIVVLVVASAPRCRIAMVAPARAAPARAPVRAPARAPLPGGVPHNVVPVNGGSLFLEMAP